MMRELIRDTLFLIGTAAIGWGLWRWSPSLGAIFAGIAVIYIALSLRKE